MAYALAASAPSAAQTRARTPLAAQRLKRVWGCFQPPKRSGIAQRKPGKRRPDRYL